MRCDRASAPDRRSLHGTCAAIAVAATAGVGATAICARVASHGGVVVAFVVYVAPLVALGAILVVDAGSRWLGEVGRARADRVDERRWPRASERVPVVAADRPTRPGGPAEVSFRPAPKPRPASATARAPPPGRRP